MIKAVQETKQKQTLSISQTTIQACNILAMGIDELYAYIQDIALENPLISFQSSPYLSSGIPAELFPSHAIDLDSLPFVGCTEIINDLQSILSLQIPRNLPRRMSIFVRQLIHYLDQDGYLRESQSVLCHCIGCSEEEFLAALSVIQSMYPAGVGARNLQECLLLQLKEKLSPDSLELRIISQFFDLLANNRTKELAKRLGCSITQINSAIENIRDCSAHPAWEYCNASPQYIIPDVQVHCKDGIYQVQLNSDAALSVDVDDSYSQQFSDIADPEVHQWINERYRQAALIKSFVNKRNNTLLLVCKEIFQAQKAFFYKGPEYLRPLRQKEIAEALSCHESTVYRAVKDKYLSCSWGSYPLNYFFSNALSCDDEFGAYNARQLIIRYIREEDKTNPLSDNTLSQKLSEQGIQISRRTVTKYREHLGIPSTSFRRKYV